MEADEIKNRILEFLRTENKSSAQFAQEIGVQPSGISHIVSGRNKPSLDFIIKMLTRYPSLSADWLLFGKGRMSREGSTIDLFNQQDEASTSDKDIFSVIPGISTRKEDPGEVMYSAGTGEKQTVQHADKPKTSKIVIFSTDGTFSEYTPR